MYARERAYKAVICMANESGAHMGLKIRGSALLAKPRFQRAPLCTIPASACPTAWLKDWYAHTRTYRHRVSYIQTHTHTYTYTRVQF
jgi:hypothetical protein